MAIKLIASHAILLCLWYHKSMMYILLRWRL